MKNALLLLVALICASFLIPLGIVFTFARAIWEWNWRKAVGYLAAAAGSLALAIDHFGNTICRDLFNAIFITRRGYRFGNIKETISSVLGKNFRDDTLSVAGAILVVILDAIDPNHVLKAIKD